MTLDSLLGISGPSLALFNVKWERYISSCHRAALGIQWDIVYTQPSPACARLTHRALQEQQQERTADGVWGAVLERGHQGLEGPLPLEEPS